MLLGNIGLQPDENKPPQNNAPSLRPVGSASSRSDVEATGTSGARLFIIMSTKTIQQLEQENADLIELLRKTRDQLTMALEEVARNHAKMQAKGEYHHRAFERICPMPDLSQITVIK